MVDEDGYARLKSIPIILINLEHRTDRLKDSIEALASGMGRSVDDNVYILRPRKFEEAGGFINAGYRSCLDSHLRAAQEKPYWIENSKGITGSQAYIVRGAMLPRWIEHMTKISTGEPGDNVTGPMGPDGAMTTVTWADTSVKRIIPIPNLVAQRSSLSDINAKTFDNIGVLMPVLSVARLVKRKLRGRAIAQESR